MNLLQDVQVDNMLARARIIITLSLSLPTLYVSLALTVCEVFLYSLVTGHINADTLIMSAHLFNASSASIEDRRYRNSWFSASEIPVNNLFLYVSNIGMGWKSQNKI